MAASDQTPPAAPASSAAPRIALNQLKDELAAYAKEKAGTVREHTNQLVDGQKTAAAEGLLDLSDVLRQTADHLRQRQRTAITDLVETAADRVEGVASAIRDRDIGELLDDTKRLAQRQPELFFAGAVVLGLLFTRILRSAAPQRPTAPVPARQHRLARHALMPDGGEDRSVAALIGELASETTILVRKEFELARAELAHNAAGITGGAITLAIGIALVLLAAEALIACAILVLMRWLEPWLAALSVGSGVMVLGAILVAIGRHRFDLRRLTRIATIATLKRDRDWAKEQLNGRL